MPEAETRAVYRELLQAPATAGGACGGAPGPPSRPGSRGQAAELRPIGRLVGRAVELEQLRQARKEAWEGRGGLAMVVGEAGIGKSRLVAELIAEATVHGGRVVVGRAHELASALPFGPWVDAIRTGSLLDEVIPTLPGPPLAELGRLFPELDAPRPRGGPTPGSHVRLFEALARVWQGLAAQGPLVLVLEDLHWADEMSLWFLNFLAPRIAGWPLLLVGTAREEELASASPLRRVLQGLGRDRLETLIRLGPLSREDTIDLVQAHARPVERGNESLAERLWTLSRGNPLVVVETVHALRDGEIPAEAAAALPLASSIRETIERRLDRLGERARQVAGVVAVIGREFDFDLLCRVTLLDAPGAADAVEELVGRGFLDTSGERLAFAHERLQEVAYARLLTPVRRLWHQRVAESVEAFSRERRAPPEPEALAYHFAEAGLAPQALEYLRRASRRAIEQSAYGEAITHLRRGLELLPALGDHGARLAHELGLQLGLGEALIVIRGYAAPEVEAAFTRARALCAEAGAAPFPAVSGLFHYFLTRGDVGTARTFAAQLGQLAGDDGPAEHRVVAGRDAEARALVAEPYRAFTEGLDTQDLRRARELLESRAGQRLA